MLSPDLKTQVIGLPVHDRLELMQVIVSSLQANLRNYFEPGVTYEVWTPIEAPQAAQKLLELLEADQPSAHV